MYLYLISYYMYYTASILYNNIYRATLSISLVHDTIHIIYVWACMCLFVVAYPFSKFWQGLFLKLFLFPLFFLFLCLMQLRCASALAIGVTRIWCRIILVTLVSCKITNPFSLFSLISGSRCYFNWCGLWSNWTG